MTDRRNMMLGLLAGAAGMAAMVNSGRAATDADGKAAIEAWTDALYKGDPATIESFLAPEFQLMRSDGTSFDRVSYLKSLPRFTSRVEIAGLTVTGSNELMVASYVATVEMTVNNQPAIAKAPRLSVFRKNGDVWQAVAHANFAKIG